MERSLNRYILEKRSIPAHKDSPSLQGKGSPMGQTRDIFPTVSMVIRIPSRLYTCHNPCCSPVVAAGVRSSLRSGLSMRSLQVRRSTLQLTINLDLGKKNRVLLVDHWISLVLARQMVPSGKLKSVGKITIFSWEISRNVDWAIFNSELLVMEGNIP